MLAEGEEDLDGPSLLLLAMEERERQCKTESDPKSMFKIHVHVDAHTRTCRCSDTCIHLCKQAGVKYCFHFRHTLLLCMLP